MTRLRTKLAISIGLYAVILLLATSATTSWRHSVRADLAQSFDTRLRNTDNKPEKLLQAHREHLENRRRIIKRTSIKAFLVLSLFVVVSSWVFSRILGASIALPVAQLAERVEHLNATSAWQSVKPTGIYEIDTLYTAVADAAVRLNIQYEKLDRLNDMRGQLLSMASHEYGNFMTAVLTGLNLLESGQLAPDKEKKIFDMVQSNARTLVRMGEDFINLAQAELGVVDLSTKPLNLAKLTRNLIKMSEMRINARQITVTTSIPDDLPRVMAHRQTLSFVINNLIGNAAKYARDGGRISVTLTPLEQSVEFSVEDDGAGMDARSIERALSGGFRSKEVRKSSHGFGVGLSLVQEILTAHDAPMAIESLPGKGSRFAFKLPLAPKKAQLPKPSVASV